ncbi:hypothetical protein M422DRAFT_47886 [Sphaerobolus stellatus SS14]|uniref:DUF6818 domain-containing protein n=1 Tax=Sphaerobolus stellatus (strain SS14) TaxID=990650 RepID=A0A0C9VX93_SPHS4|nr:hypothetical protein M422DRAFT_47886 [Sphaerobolus stellatus SS14]
MFDSHCTPTGRQDVPAITLPPLHTPAGVGNAHRAGPAPSDEFPKATFAALTANRTPDTQHVLSATPVLSHAQGGSGVVIMASQQPPNAPPPKKNLMKPCPIPRPVKTVPKAAATDESKKCGRQVSAHKWADDEVKHLLNVVKELLPIGGNGWNEVMCHFNELGAEAGAPARNVKNLEARFHKLHQTHMPPGDSQVPPNVQHTLDINELINRKAGIVVISDNEDMSDDTSSADVTFPDDSVVVDGSNDEDANPHPVKVKKKEASKPDKGKGRVDPPAASLSKASYVVAHLAHPALVTAVPTGPF